MQCSIRELFYFETVIEDDPLDLFTQIEKLIHFLTRALYSTLSLIKILTSMMVVKKHDNEKLLTYLLRFKSGRNVVKSLFGNQLLDCHVEHTSEDNCITYVDAADMGKQ